MIIELIRILREIGATQGNEQILIRFKLWLKEKKSSLRAGAVSAYAIYIPSFFTKRQRT